MLDLTPDERRIFTEIIKYSPPNVTRVGEELAIKIQNRKVEPKSGHIYVLMDKPDGENESFKDKQIKTSLETGPLKIGFTNVGVCTRIHDLEKGNKGKKFAIVKSYESLYA